MTGRDKPKYYLVEAGVLPEVFTKVTEARELLETGEVRTVADAVDNFFQRQAHRNFHQTAFSDLSGQSKYFRTVALLGSKRRERLSAVERVGISRSAFYKYKDSVMPFRDMRQGSIVTFNALLRDKKGVLSSLLAIFADSGANILTINQSIPTNGTAFVTISAITETMAMGMDELIAAARALYGVIRFDALAG